MNRMSCGMFLQVIYGSVRGSYAIAYLHFSQQNEMIGIIANQQKRHGRGRRGVICCRFIRRPGMDSYAIVHPSPLLTKKLTAAGNAVSPVEHWVQPFSRHVRGSIWHSLTLPIYVIMLLVLSYVYLPGETQYFLITIVTPPHVSCPSQVIFCQQRRRCPRRPGLVEVLPCEQSCRFQGHLRVAARIDQQ